MPRKNIKGIFEQPMDAKADPIVENKNLPGMDDEVPVKKSTGKQKIMAPVKKGTTTMRGEPVDKTKPAMSAIPRLTTAVKPRPLAAGKELPDMKEVQRRKTTPGYVVMRMRVQNGTMQVVGSRKVDSELLEDVNLLTGGLTYEAEIANQRIALGSVPDFGERRSFPKPGSGPGEEHHGHHFSELPSFEFNVKLPAEKVNTRLLPKTDVKLYRFKDIPTPTLRANITAKSLDTSNETRLVAHLKGIKLSGMKKEVAAEVKKAIK